MYLSDPVFLEAIRRLQEEKPLNYHCREIDLYNNGQDAIQQQHIITGSILIVLDLPKFCKIHIQFNEVTNDPILLKKGVIIFDFYQFFLTYEHTEKPGYSHPDLLELLIGKDIIFAEQPVSIEKFSKTIIPYEQIHIPVGTGKYVLPSKYANEYSYDYYPYTFNVAKFSQIRGLLGSYCYLGGTHHFYVNQFFKGFSVHKTEIEIPQNIDTPFIIDLVTSDIQFEVDKDSSITWDIMLFVKAWCY